MARPFPLADAPWLEERRRFSGVAGEICCYSLHRSQISKPYPCSWFNSLVGERVIFNRIFSGKSGAISNCIAVGNWREDFLPNSVPPRSILASDGDFYGAQTLGEADQAGVLE